MSSLLFLLVVMLITHQTTWRSVFISMKRLQIHLTFHQEIPEKGVGDSGLLSSRNVQFLRELNWMREDVCANVDQSCRYQNCALALTKVYFKFSLCPFRFHESDCPGQYLDAGECITVCDCCWTIQGLTELTAMSEAVLDLWEKKGLWISINYSTPYVLWQVSILWQLVQYLFKKSSFVSQPEATCAQVGSLKSSRGQCCIAPICILQMNLPWGPSIYFL